MEQTRKMINNQFHTFNVNRSRAGQFYWENGTNTYKFRTCFDGPNRSYSSANKFYYINRDNFPDKGSNTSVNWCNSAWSHRSRTNLERGDAGCTSELQCVFRNYFQNFGRL